MTLYSEGIQDRYVYSVSKHAAQHTDQYVQNQLIPYIGNKRKLLDLIATAVATSTKDCDGGTFADLFGGSGVVARYAKREGLQVTANDWEPYAYSINQCYIAQNIEPEFKKLGGADNVLETLNGLIPLEGFVSTYLCPKDDKNADPLTERMFFTRENGMIIDAIRTKIQEWIDEELITDNELAYLIAPLMYSVSLASNTSGVFNAYHAGWGGKTNTGHNRILGTLSIQKPVLFNNHMLNTVTQMDAEARARELAKEKEIDIVYLDPPYNQHSYGSNYHVLNTVALWDLERVKKDLTVEILPGNKAAIRRDWLEERRSEYNRKQESKVAFKRLLEAIRAHYTLISYSTDGHITVEEMIRMAGQTGALEVTTRNYGRYRVSTQRKTDRASTTEFVLTIDHHGKSSVDKEDEIINLIRSKNENQEAS